MTDSTRTIYQRLHVNLALAELYARSDQWIPEGLRLEIEHDEALLAQTARADEAQRLDDAQAEHDARMERYDPENWRLWLAAAAVALLGAAALRWSPWW